MHCCTLFVCDRVEFSAVDAVDQRPLAVDKWHPARVSVTDIVDENRWLLVIIKDNPLPVVWRALKDDWTLTCDESELICMQRRDAGTSTQSVQKMRFSVRGDYWTFLAHLMHGRVLGHSNDA
ncbi:hypothetical protein FKP32DRAFT_1567335 [Trametes sanguinea]|nr:hypothetical protein FKP32DRAFT_1567335 [Trametes sanguinea]